MGLDIVVLPASILSPVPENASMLGGVSVLQPFRSWLPARHKFWSDGAHSQLGRGCTARQSAASSVWRRRCVSARDR